MQKLSLKMAYDLHSNPLEVTALHSICLLHLSKQLEPVGLLFNEYVSIGTRFEISLKFSDSIKGSHKSCHVILSI